MAIDDELDGHLERLAGVLGHADRRTGLMDYGRGLMLLIERQSVEPLAASIPCMFRPNTSPCTTL